MSDRARGGLRRVSTQAFLAALVLVLVGPGLVFTGFLLTRYADAKRASYAQEAQNIARQMANAIDRDLTGLLTTLQTLSTSTLLLEGDMAGFHAQAMTVRSFINADVGLRRPDGQMMVNTRLPFGAPLPRTILPVDQQVLDGGQPVVSDSFVGTLSNRTLFAIVLAVPPGAMPNWLLHVSAPTDRIAATVRQGLPRGWVIGVGDNAGNYIARSDRHEEFAGKPGQPEFLRQTVGIEGSFVGRDPFGAPILVGYARSAVAGWIVAASIPQDMIEQPLRRDLFLLIAFGALALLLSGLLTYWLWGIIARPLKALAAAGPAIGTDSARLDVTSPVREVAELADVIRAASAELEARVAERTRALGEANKALVAEMTRREAAEGQLRQVQKMEAIGQLTGGIAHDFNNMLAVITGGLDLIRRRLARGDTDVAKFVDAAMDGARRAAMLTSRLLAFSRQQPLAPEASDANKLVAGMSELLHRSIGEAIRMETVLAGGLWRIHADVGQLENAILNLAVNARDAMPDGGRLTIETANCYLDEEYARGQAGVVPGQYVMIAVTDTGMGMTDEVAARAFEPFFTTKPVGQGTGLGLSQVYGFVRQTGGHVKIYAEPGHGTTIKIYLPRFYGPADAPASAAAGSTMVGPAAGEVILVVEDEERVRQLSVENLRDLGYTVLSAANGSEGLRLLDARPDVALLFTDIVMPDMNGRRLADEALRRRPGLKVLYTTGFTRNAVVHNGVLDPGVSVLQKPFSVDQLGARIREILDAP